MSQVILDPTFWTALGVVLAMTAWFVRLERRLGYMLSREEHQRICAEHQHSITEKLNGITETLHRQDKGAEHYRDRVLDELKELAIDVAVVQSQMGISRRRRVTSTPADPDGDDS